MPIVEFSKEELLFLFSESLKRISELEAKRPAIGNVKVDVQLYRSIVAKIKARYPNISTIEEIINEFQ